VREIRPDTRADAALWVQRYECEGGHGGHAALDMLEQSKCPIPIPGEGEVARTASDQGGACRLPPKGAKKKPTTSPGYSLLTRS
jgi:hypothetical protein